MKNLVFLLWVLLWPIASEFASLIMAWTYRVKEIKQKQHSDLSDGLGTIVELTIWLTVAIALFER